MRRKSHKYFLLQEVVCNTMQPLIELAKRRSLLSFVPQQRHQQQYARNAMQRYLMVLLEEYKRVWTDCTRSCAYGSLCCCTVLVQHASVDLDIITPFHVRHMTVSIPSSLPRRFQVVHSLTKLKPSGLVVLYRRRFSTIAENPNRNG